MKVLLLDNYDSFTYNLYHYLEPLCSQVDVVRNDVVDIEAVASYDAIVLSPGPGLPRDAGRMMQLIASYAETKPMLGVCLGHQALSEHFGAKLLNLDEVLHGQPSEADLIHDDLLFHGISSPTTIGHYHSWVVDEDEFPEALTITARSQDGFIMAMRHESLPLRGVQFHPESILTPEGKKMLRNWVDDLQRTKFVAMAKDIRIAIDGHSACGKSTVAKLLAERLGFLYIDSGSMYRAVALFALDNGIAEGRNVDVENLVNRLHEIDLDFVRHGAEMDLLMNGVEVEDYIRNMRVSHVVSPVSAIPEVRTKLVALQQAIGDQGGVIMDGRDIGTVVFPDAELKIFLTASVAERGRRRWAELQARGNELDMAEILANLQERDLIDSQRAVSPLTLAADAVLVDNSSMDVQQTLNRLMEEVNRVRPVSA